MKVSNKTKYGLQFMLRLAVSHGNKFVTIKEIAKTDGIPEKFLENIVSIIKSSNLITVKRGASGGYQLAKRPEEILIRDIYEVLEGTILPDDVDAQNTHTLSYEVTDVFWLGLKESIEAYFKAKNLAELVEIYRNKSGGLMYYI